MCARHGRHAEGRATVRNVEHRRGMQPTHALPKTERRNRIEAVHDKVGVTQHHPLGAPGCTSRVEQSREVVVASARIRSSWRRRQDVFVVDKAVGGIAVTYVDHMLDVIHAPAKSIENRQELIVDE